MSFLRPSIFRGRTAVVTGGGSGIGFAIARELVELSCSVVIAGRSESKLSEAVDQLQARSTDGVTVAHKQCNIREEEAVRDALQVGVDEVGVGGTR